jgi:phenylalanyl-tRNA synthetase alpha subunit
MKAIEEVIADLYKACEKKVISEEDIKECISALVDANNLVDEEIKETDEALVNAEKDHKEELEEIKEELENDLDEAIKKSLPVISILDELRLEPIKRMYQNLNIQQLEEVENFARSIVKHPAKYIEFIHEN